MPMSLDLTGQNFGRWTVLSKTGCTKHNTQWQVRCVCGTIKQVLSGNLKNGSSKSCGCLRREQKRKYGVEAFGDTPVYHAWHDMLRRCTNPKHKTWKDYGGRGIKVTRRWRKFELFFQDMGHPPQGHVLDRKNNDGNYSRRNCRWVTWHESAKNRRTTVWVDYDGKQWGLSELGRHLKISPSKFYRQFRKEGRTVEEIIKLNAINERKRVQRTGESA